MDSATLEYSYTTTGRRIYTYEGNFTTVRHEDLLNDGTWRVSETERFVYIINGDNLVDTIYGSSMSSYDTEWQDDFYSAYKYDSGRLTSVKTVYNSSSEEYFLDEELRITYYPDGKIESYVFVVNEAGTDAAALNAKYIFNYIDISPTIIPDRNHAATKPPFAATVSDGRIHIISTRSVSVNEIELFDLKGSLLSRHTRYPDIHNNGRITLPLRNPHSVSILQLRTRDGSIVMMKVNAATQRH
jgi:hypothetical protein